MIAHAFIVAASLLILGFWIALRTPFLMLGGAGVTLSIFMFGMGFGIMIAT